MSQASLDERCSTLGERLGVVARLINETLSPTTSVPPRHPNPPPPSFGRNLSANSNMMLFG